MFRFNGMAQLKDLSACNSQFGLQLNNSCHTQHKEVEPDSMPSEPQHQLYAPAVLSRFGWAPHLVLLWWRRNSAAARTPYPVLRRVYNNVSDLSSSLSSIKLSVLPSTLWTKIWLFTEWELSFRCCSVYCYFVCEVPCSNIDRDVSWPENFQNMTVK